MLADAGHRIGAATAIICNLFNPDRVIIGGVLAAAYDILLRRCAPPSTATPCPSPAHRVTVCQGQLGDRAVALGAVATVPQVTNRFVNQP